MKMRAAIVKFSYVASNRIEALSVEEGQRKRKKQMKEGLEEE